MIGLLVILALCCAATILLEAIPVLFTKERKAWWKAGVICNVVTNPILNTVLALLWVLIEETQVVVGIMFALEAAVVLIEAYFYQKMLGKPFKICFWFSLAANVISFWIGTGVFRLLQ